MSLDACFLTFLTKQLNSELAGSRVDKIYMPSKDETVFALRGNSKHKLLISASTNAPRICIGEGEYENPSVPPTFCMVLRKHFTSARLKRVYMPSLERCIVFDFECKNDFFEPVSKEIVVELMGRSANMILTSQGIIIDAIRRVDLSGDCGRCILPSAKYEFPKPQEGKTPFDEVLNADAIFENPELTLESAIMAKVSGISPIVARELAYRASGRSDMRIRQLGTGDKERLEALIFQYQSDIKEGICNPCIVIRKDNSKLVDFCFTDITQYGDFCEIKSVSSPSEAVFGFFESAARKARFEQKTKDLSQFISRTYNRISKTMEVRKKELADSEKAEKFRLYGELVNANLYRIEKGQTFVNCENYYDDCKEVKIPLKAELTPSKNAEAYFKKYTKAKNSKKVLTELIKKDKEELSYLDSVFMALCECESANDANEIRKELEREGYLRRRAKVKMSEKPTKPRQFEKDGFLILAGRNNLQNDLVTVKLSRKNDIWLHTKNVHSSHVIICCMGKNPPPSVIEFAAKICAYYSMAKNDLKTEVDFCPVQNVRKPNGAKAGMVVYDGYETVVVNPFTEEQISNLLKSKE